MDNKLNEIRRKISRLRAEMLSLQQDMRALVNHDLDCLESSIRLMTMRAEMVDLIRQRDAMGGVEACPNIAERLMQNYRPELRRRNVTGKERPGKESPGKEKPGRSRALST
jgi:hypothetical protein